MLCAKNWDCGKSVSVSDAWHAPDDFFRAYFSFDSFEFIKPRRHGMLVGFLRLWVGGCEEVGVLNVAAAKSPLAESFIPHLAHWAL